MQDIDLLEALRLWSDGRRLDEYSMLSIPFLWWGRAGKIASIAGGLVVILDYAGEERLRQWGRGLKTKPLHRLLIRMKNNQLVFILGLVGLIAVGWRLQRLIGERIAAVLVSIQDVFFRHVWWVGSGWMLITLIVLAGFLSQLFEKRRWLSRAFLVLSSAGIYFLVAIGLVSAVQDLVTFGVIVTSVALGTWLIARLADIAIPLLDVVIVRPIAWALSRETPGQPIKWTGFSMLLMGQLMDLLTS